MYIYIYIYIYVEQGMPMYHYYRKPMWMVQGDATIASMARHLA